MANPFQQRIRFRKLTYAALILVLFTVSLIHRRFVVEAQANALQLREVSRGEVELTSSAVRLTLTGSRGIAVTFLWAAALGAQEKHEWNEVELLVNSITKLQPYFITPWLFQSWNLAFNVSVECDMPRDKYYYVSRGLELLAEGERRNQGSGEEAGASDPRRPRFPGNPEMRHHMGFTYQLKIGTSDEKHVMRCLLDLSCIDPVDRDPDRFFVPVERGGREIDFKKLDDFSHRYPRLVRRLRDKLGYNSGRLIVAFLADNREVPSRFEKAQANVPETPVKKSLRDQFPILPPKLEDNWPDPTTRDLSSEALDVFLLCRTWYSFSQFPLPPPHTDIDKDPDTEKGRYRLPKRMATIIFRSYPARAQSYIAENLAYEGWFDRDGWLIPRWRDLPPGVSDPEVRVGTDDKYHSGLAWQEAYRKYSEFGKKNGLLLSPAEQKQLEADAKPYQDLFLKAGPEGVPTPRSGKLAESYRAADRLRWQNSYRHLTNFAAHLGETDGERTPEAVLARKLFFEADRLRRAEQAPEQALELYEEAMPIWTDVLLQNQSFRKITSVQEDTYEIQLYYLRLLQLKGEDLLRPLTLGTAQLALWPHVRFDQLLTSGEKLRIIPIRRIRGPLDRMLVYEGPQADELKTFLLSWSQGLILGPKLVVPGQQHRFLTTAFSGPPPPPSAPWQPLLEQTAIDSVRDRLGLNVERQQPPPGIAPTAPAPAPMP
jgi:hypothetical protein